MKTIAIVGASGLVGEKLVEIVSDKLPDFRLRLFGNSSVGKRLQIRGKNLVIESCENLKYGEITYALFAATNEISQKYIPKLVEDGVTCIDNSSAFRMDKDVPLVVPCINGHLTGGKKLISNPNCSTIQVVLAVNALKCFNPYKMTAVTYQAVSGAGKDALTDLSEKRGYGKLKSFPHPIYDNVIPFIGEEEKNGFTSEELKMVNESRKILNLPKLKVNAFCARIPVTNAHCVFVNLALREKFTLDEIRDRLKNAENVLLFDDPEAGVYPMPMMLRQTKYAGVGRITKDLTSNAVNFFVVADNLLRGASYNAYEILQTVINYDQNEIDKR